MFRLFRLYLPLLLLILPWAVAPSLRSLDPALQQLVSSLPILLALLAFLLAAGFKRGRIALAAAHLGLTAYLIQTARSKGVDQPDAYVLFTLTSLVIPLVHGWLLIQRDTSPLCRRGVVKLILTLAPSAVLLGMWLVPGQLGSWLPDLHPSLLETLGEDSLLNRGSVWIGAPVLALSLLLTITRRTADEIALFGSLLAQMLAISTLKQSHLSTQLLILAPTLLIIAVISHIYAMAFVDTLTGVPARRALEHKLAGLGRHYGIAMLDIDHFKKFNDTYGHDVGDQVLRMVATQLRKVQAGGTLFRYGGEEFTIVFSGRREEEVVEALDEVRQRVEQYPMRVRAPQRPRSNRQGKQARENSARDTEQVSVTISIGIAWREADERPEMVIKRADKALYKAKGAGRNRVMTDGPDPRRQRRRAVA
ncbi:GGDEF domain-containing protein [Marinobacterium sp. D7]|uniref:GGDEF domain-containing protein n=1 Tax=Marinobacterium ramblicola TaxID=2849041 RepID=UPI001C2CEFD3|nr:GGDEF domain-containing protein [Marinobacterium ramblicola]MBV1786477.1 GGDEF domain-containing protein [Marinobacterium ramblicola]